MKPTDTSDFSILAAILWVSLGGYAGLMSYLMKTVNDGNKPKFWRSVLEALAAVSIGTTVMLMCTALGWNTLWTGVMVSVSGWIGPAAAIRIMEAVALKRLGLTRDDVKPTEQNHD